MMRFEQKPTPVIHVAIALAMTAVFFADLFTPLGIAVWVIYLLPFVISLYVWRPKVPLAVAVLATILMGIGYFLSPPAAGTWMARINRGFGIVTIWVVAGIGYQFIRNKLLVQRQSWLQSGQTQLSERMGGDQQLPRLGENVLRFLSEYVDALQRRNILLS